MNSKFHFRTVLIFKNIIYSLVWRIGSGFLSYLFIPIIASMIDAEKFGIWSLISGFFSWLILFDFGLLNSFRNKYTEALSTKDYFSASEWLSTTFFLLVGIVFFLLVVLLSIILLVDLNELLSTDLDSFLLRKLLIVSLLLIASRFVFSILSTILVASHKSSFASFIDFFGSCISLVGLLLLKSFGLNDLLFVTICSLFGPSLVFILGLFIFQFKYSDSIKISLRYFSLIRSKSLLSTGINFLLIQLGMVVIFSSGQFFVIHYVGPIDSGYFAIVSKYFNLLTILFSVVLNPIWTGFNDARAQNDNSWINNTFKQLFSVWVLFLVISLLLIYFYKYFFLLWIGNSIPIDFYLVFACGIFTVLQLWIYMFSNFINSTGYIKIQTVLIVAGAIITFIFSYLFVRLFGSVGVFYAGILGLLPLALILPIQSFKLLTGTGSKNWRW